jgi:mRNA-decapping enzyme 1B
LLFAGLLLDLLFTRGTMASVTEDARRQANLKLLQRTCHPTIAEILQTATHVVLYEFKNNTWTKCGVEGSSFLAASGSAVKLIIINRNSADNFELKVTTELQIQEQDPFLISHEPPPNGGSGAPRVRGIWFHNADERVAMTHKVQATVQELVAGTFVFPVSKRVPAAKPPPPTKDPPTKDPPTKAPPTPGATQDERDHLAALLSKTAVAVTASHSQPRASQAAPETDAASSTSSAASGVALDKKAMQLTLLSLIQDERFLDLLHSQYLRVVHARSKKGPGDSDV